MDRNNYKRWLSIVEKSLRTTSEAYTVFEERTSELQRKVGVLSNEIKELKKVYEA